MSEVERSIVPDADRTNTGRIYAVVFGVGIACSLAIVSVHEVTGPIIAANKVAFRRSSILEVLPGCESIAAYRFDEAAGQFELATSDTGSSDLVFAGFDGQGELVGLAIETKGMGYQDYIGLIYGYSFDKQAIIGIRVLESRETPGLGDRIETDDSFLQNFVQLDVSLSPDGKQLAHPIEFVKPGTKSAPWQIDGITGATISSRATAEMLRESAGTWMPRVYPHRAEFQPSVEEGP